MPYPALPISKKPEMGREKLQRGREAGQNGVKLGACKINHINGGHLKRHENMCEASD